MCAITYVINKWLHPIVYVDIKNYSTSNFIADYANPCL